jgi:hypothetical protein
VIINEIAWGGTAADASDEWLELFNATDQAISLTGWSLNALDSELAISLTGIIDAGDFFLLERTDDDTLSDIPADVIYTGALDDAGETLQLLDAVGNLVDTANLAGGPWPAGSLGPGHYSMERVDPTLPDTSTNWASNNGVIRSGLDAQGDSLNGTPRQPNSTALAPPGSPPTPTSAAPSPTPTEPSATATSSPTPSTSPAPAAASPTPTEPPSPVPSPRPTETEVPADTAAVGEEDQPPASSALAAVPLDNAEQQPSESASPGREASPPYWLFALGLGLILVLIGVFLVRRT